MKQHFCKTCLHEFSDHLQLANHIRWKHKRQTTQKLCAYCNIVLDAPNVKQHERKCGGFLNFVWCLTCGKSTPNHKFCSSSCSATHNNKLGIIGYAIYRKNNDVVKKRTYHDVCFEFWPRICALCNWSISVDVHHIDSNHHNNDKKNLIPLCQNHHLMTRMNEYADELQQKLLMIVEEKFAFK